MDWPEITKDTPLEEIKRIHQQIWQYVVENGEKPETPYGCTSCVLCNYVRLHSNDCRDCPAVWVNGQMDCNCFSIGSPYNGWKKYLSFGKRIAEKIRDIPFKYELEKKGAEE